MAPTTQIEVDDNQDFFWDGQVESLHLGVVRDPSVGFDIGWDYYAHGLRIPRDLRQAKESLPILQGYAAAKERNVPQQAQDRFVRKWLSLRVGAWRRNRFVDASVTPEYLRFLDIDVCPVTGHPLTYGTGGPWDWSVDRVNNDAAYTQGNLIVVSSFANNAKGSHSYKEIVSFAFDENTEPPKAAVNWPARPPLTRIEWARWSLICCHAPVDECEERGKAIAPDPSPCVIVPPSGLYMRASSLIQILVAGKAKGADRGDYKLLLAAVSKPKRPILNDLVKRASRKQVQFPLEVWFDRQLYQRFFELYQNLSDQEHVAIRALVPRIFGAVARDGSQTDFKFESKGFVSGAGRSR